MHLLITGSTGIAEATASLARERRHQVFTVGLDENADLRADLRKEESADAAISAALTQMGSINALFHVAGMSGRRYGDGPLHDCTLDGFEATIKTNSVTAFLMNRALVRHWLERNERGAIVNMGSVLADSPEPNYFATCAYAASKGGINAMTRASAAYYAPYGIRFNVIAAALVKTPMSERAQSNAEILDFVARKQPLSGGILGPAEIASAALFLLGDESRHITGQVLNVDAGWSLS